MGGPGTGPVYYVPALESLTRIGEDLLIGVWLSTILAGVPSRHGSVRLIGQYTPAGNIETIDGLSVANYSNGQRTLFSEDTASQLRGTYIADWGTGSDYSPYDGSGTLRGEAFCSAYKPLPRRLADLSTAAYRLAA